MYINILYLFSVLVQYRVQYSIYSIYTVYSTVQYRVLPGKLIQHCTVL